MKVKNQFRECETFPKITKSDVPGKVSHTAFEGFCNLGKGFKGNLPFRPLDGANVIPRQISFFRQLFLAQTSFSPLDADSFPHNVINPA
jgi:hypothetical protein